MQRPDFQKMLKAAEMGYVLAVFVKDLSRLDRNYIEVGKLTEKFFPQHDICLAAISDGADTAEVVRRIFRVALEGYGLSETAATLEKDGIVNSTYYWWANDTNLGGSKSTVEPTQWGHTTIKKILERQEYCGDVINFKTYSKSYKMKYRIETPEENRAVFLNVHEAIIDRIMWEKVQTFKAGTHRKKPSVMQVRSAFSG